MQKDNKKELIIIKGAEIIHKKGFNNTGIQEILTAAGIPKGSFYFYFKDKKDFGLQVIDYFYSYFQSIGDQIYQAVENSYLEGLKDFYRGFNQIFQANHFQGGCPIGNFSLELDSLDDDFRQKIDQAFLMMKTIVKKFLSAAEKQGEFTPKMDLEQLTEFIVYSWEGAIIRMKVMLSLEPIELWLNTIYKFIL